MCTGAGFEMQCETFDTAMAFSGIARSAAVRSMDDISPPPPPPPRGHQEGKSVEEGEGVIATCQRDPRKSS